MRRVSWPRIAVLAFLVVLLGLMAYAIFVPHGGGSQEGVYAYVGSQPVTLSELERNYANRDPTQQNLTMREYFNETYAPRTMLLLDAERQGLTTNDSTVDAWITTINTSLQSKNVTFQEYLDSLNVTYDQLRSDIRTSTTLDAILTKEVASQVNVTASEIEQAYNAGDYAANNVTLDQARYQIGPKILRQKQDARLKQVIAQLRERYDVRYV